MSRYGALTMQDETQLHISYRATFCVSAVFAVSNVRHSLSYLVVNSIQVTEDIVKHRSRPAAP